jgi:alpha-tubulin suppressor-like RCC1 family protein
MTKTLSCSTSTPEAIAGARSVANGIVLLTAILSLAALSPDLARAQAGELFPLYAEVSAGYDHTCAVTTTGGVKCWGGNAYGELGNGTTINSIPVVDVSGLTSGVSAVSSGNGHSCALASNGAVKCWGNNQFGELGNGSSIASSTPVDVSGMSSGIAAISIGGFHSCALTTSGGVKCWGDNTYGQLGNNTTIASNTPVDVSGLTSGVAAISAGANHTCALTTGGGVKCWGDGVGGDLGNGAAAQSNTAVNVSGLTSGVAAISAGGFHSCALTTAGGAKCWGDNTGGDLGNVASTPSNTPVDVSGLTSGVTVISAGYFHTCALTTGGNMVCWGDNGSGQFGGATNTSISSSTAFDVPGLASGVATVSAGGFHTCAITTSGGMNCFGAAGSGQVGNSANFFGFGIEHTSNILATDVNGLTSGVASVAPGYSHICALTTSAGAICWGDNSKGQLGNGSLISSDSAVNVNGLTSGVATLAAGDHFTCALTTSGGAKCWGSNSNGQLGNGTTTDSSTPIEVSGLTSGVAAISASGNHACAVTTSGAMKCWGGNNDGQLGDNSTADSATTVGVVGLGSGVAAISTGTMHTCALTTNGGVKCWGYNFFGQLGNSTSDNSSTPVDVTGLASGIAAIASGDNRTCALTTGGGVKCWGYNSLTSSGQPVDVTGLTSGVSAIAAGSNNACALTTTAGVKCWGSGPGVGNDLVNQFDGMPADVAGLMHDVNKMAATHDAVCVVTTNAGIKCWGDNTGTFDHTNSGPPPYNNTPVDVRGLTSGIVASASGTYHSCALTTSGGVKCWGYNAQGELGNGTTANAAYAVDVSCLSSGVSAIVAGDEYSCALTTAGGVKCWGTNGNGELGNGTTTATSTPTDVTRLTSGVAAIAAGEAHTCALTTTGGMKCWGINTYGQLGDGSKTNRSTAVDVGGLTSGVAALSVGGLHTCALTTAGGAKCWGLNQYGELGNGTTTSTANAVNVKGLTSGVAAISAGYSHTCALTTTGGIKCWGFNGVGQLGDGTTTDSKTAVDVTGLTSGGAAISAGYSHTCAIAAGGALMCWGDNLLTNLGDAAAPGTYSSTAVGASYLTSDIEKISAGGDHSCALTATAGGVKCWGGNNGRGQTTFTATTGNAFGSAYAIYEWISTYIGPMTVISGNHGQCAPPPYAQCSLLSGSGTSVDPYVYNCSSAIPSCTGGGAPFVLAGGQVDIDVYELSTVPNDTIFADGFGG